MKKEKIIPTEQLLFYSSYLPVATTLIILSIIRMRFIYFILLIIWMPLTIIIYLIIYFKLRKPKKLEKIWKDQVENKNKNRLSSGMIVLILNTYHMPIFLFNLFLFLSTILSLIKNIGLKLTLQYTLFLGDISNISNQFKIDEIFLIIGVLTKIVSIMLLSYFTSIFIKIFESVFYRGFYKK